MFISACNTTNITRGLISEGNIGNVFQPRDRETFYLQYILRPSNHYGSQQSPQPGQCETHVTLPGSWQRNPLLPIVPFTKRWDSQKFDERVDVVDGILVGRSG